MRHWGFRDWILFVALVLPTLSALSYFHFFSDPKWMAPLYSLSKVIQFSLPLFVIFFLTKEKIRREPLSFRQFLAGNFLGLIFFGLLLLTYWVFKDFSFINESAPLIMEKLKAMGAGTLPRFVLLAIFISFLHAFLEEYYWRWYVHRELRRFFSAKVGALFSSAAFTSHHVIVINAYLPESIWHWGIVFFPAYVFVGGFIWAQMWLIQVSVMLFVLS